MTESEFAARASAREESFAQLGRNLLVFGRVLRAAGLRPQPDRMILLNQAIATVGLASRADFKAAARAVLARSPEESARFDEAFDLFWNAQLAPSRPVDREEAPTQGDPAAAADDAPANAEVTRRSEAHARLAPDDDRGNDPPTPSKDVLHPLDGDRSMTYSSQEALYQKDFSQLTRAELDITREMTRRQAWDLGRRLSRRTKAGAGGGAFDPRRTLRRSLRRAGEVLSIETRVRKMKQRDIVLLCDISGSMDRYSRLLLQFVHTMRHAVGNVEAFVFGTRLTRITREIRRREIRQAIDEVSKSVADWAGGTRIGESLRTFNQKWARRVLGRGAIVLIVSDGWDRGDVAVLASEMERLQRRSYRLIWLNPLLGSASYRPQTVGMKAALPYIDNFLPAHNLKSLMQLVTLLRTVEERRPERAQHVYPMRTVS